MNKGFTILKTDHDNFKELLKELQQTTTQSKARRQTLLTKLKDQVTEHEKIEETILYPLLEEKKATKDLTLEAFQEHHVADLLLKELEETDFKDEMWKAKLTVFQENLEHHMREEEGELFPKALKVLNDEQLKNVSDKIEYEKKQQMS